MRIDFMIHEDGVAYTAHGNTLEEDQKEEASAGGKGNGIVAHVAFEVKEGSTAETALEVIRGAHGLEIETGSSPSTLERLVAEVFRAGVAHGQQQVVK